VIEVTVVPIGTQSDVERARRQARQIALVLGFDRADAERVTLAVSELASNLLKYAQNGRIEASAIEESGRLGIRIDSLDSGPGIEDLPDALRDGVSTSGGLGGGLPGVVRLMDEFEIKTGASGTHVTTRKWLTTAS
jgi:serine/threonine-protein kinase RsbT